MKIEQLFHSLLVRQPPIYPQQPVSHSHYNSPIERRDPLPHGKSRAWGDITPEEQVFVIHTIVSEALRYRFSMEETALLLAIARVESGFNPDAASAASSASGLGQFIDKTGLTYGLTKKNRFSLYDNIHALMKHLRENLELAKKFALHSKRELYAYAYALHHDGPALNSGGLEIARKNVLPWYERFKMWLEMRASQ